MIFPITGYIKSESYATGYIISYGGDVRRIINCNIRYIDKIAL